MYEVFESSPWKFCSYPDEITIEDHTVTWKRNNGVRDLFLSESTQTVARRNISGVTILGNSIYGCTVIINCYGGMDIVGEHFEDYDAERIRDLLTKPEFNSYPDLKGMNL